MTSNSLQVMAGRPLRKVSFFITGNQSTRIEETEICTLVRQITLHGYYEKLKKNCGFQPGHRYTLVSVVV